MAKTLTSNRMRMGVSFSYWGDPSLFTLIQVFVLTPVARHVTSRLMVSAFTTFLIVECGGMGASHVFVGGGPDNPGVVVDDTLRCAHPYTPHKSSRCEYFAL